MKRLLTLLTLAAPVWAAAQNPTDSVTLMVGIDSVTVTARRPLVTYRQTGNISVDVEQLKYAPLFLGEKDIFKYLQLLPGVSAGKDGMSGILVRGGSNDQTQILYDDVPIYNQAHAFGLLSVFSGETVQSADVFKGYISPEYGSRLSALTRIRTRDGDRRNHRQSLTVGTLTLAGTADGPIVRDKGSYLISARYFFPEAVLAAIGTPIRYGFHDVTGKLTYDIARNHTLSAGIYSGDDRLSNSGDKSSNGYGWGNTAASLRLKSQWSERIQSTATLYYSWLENRQKSRFIDEETTNSGRSTFSTDEFGFRAVVDHNLSWCWSLGYGANLSYQRFDPMHTVSDVDGVHTERRYARSNLLSGAVYLDSRLRYGNWSFDAGLRGALYDNGRRTALALEPRVQLAYDFDRDNAVWLSATVNSQALVQFSRYYYSMPIEFWAPFRDDRLQRSLQVSAGGRTKLAENLTLSVEAYWKRMYNLPMIYDSDDFLMDKGGFVYGTGRSAGAEAMLQYQTDRLSLAASYTYTASRRTSDGVSYPFEYDIPHNFNLFANFDVVKRPGRRHTLSLNAAWRTGLPYRLTNMAYPDINGDPIVGVTAYPTMRMKNYFRTDISYNMERRKRNGIRNWQISVINATFHKNPVSIYPYNGKYRSTVLIPIVPSVSYTRSFGK